MNIKNVAVIGAGTMGLGIAQVNAMAGFQVVLNDVSNEALKRAESAIEKSLEKLAAGSKITPREKDQALARIKLTTSLETACSNADLLVESVFENIELKKEMFSKFDRYCPQDTILGTNTSAIPVTEISGAGNRGPYTLGIHFMNPVPLMKGVEVIRGQLTSDNTMAAGLDYVRKLGKEPAVAVDYAGFIVSRLLDVLMNEAVQLVQEGNSPEDIDKAMRLCAGHPMGPCELLDLVGAEIAMHGLETMAKDFGDKYLPHPLLKKMVRAGMLGKKSGRGFYAYN
jgi:3-hydroxybutyryl-CoA dehydrogenase